MARYAKFFSVGGGGGGTNNLQLPVGTVLDTTLRQVQDGLGTGSPLYISTLRLGITSDTSVTTQTSSVIQASTTNANLVIAPNGTGALVAQVPDGTVTGGNARGDNAVDLQMIRGNANQVAFGRYSVIAGGSTNRNNGGTYGSIGGGLSNIVSSDYSTVSGGQSNIASTNTHATVVGGQGNTASGQYSVAGGKDSNATGVNAIAIGQQANATGNGAVALGGAAGGGSGATASGQYSLSLTFNSSATATGAISIGNSSTATTQNSVVLGTSGASRSYGKFVYSNGQNGQIANCVLKRSSVLLNAAATAALYSDNSSINYNYCNAAFDAKISITCTWIATVVTVGSGALLVGDTITGKDFFFVKSIAGISSISTINRISTVNDASMVTATMNYTSTHSATTGTLFTSFVAPDTANGTTFQIVAKLETVEIGQN